MTLGQNQKFLNVQSPNLNVGPWKNRLIFSRFFPGITVYVPFFFTVISRMIPECVIWMGRVRLAKWEAPFSVAYFSSWKFYTTTSKGTFKQSKSMSNGLINRAQCYLVFKNINQEENFSCEECKMHVRQASKHVVRLFLSFTLINLPKNLVKPVLRSTFNFPFLKASPRSRENLDRLRKSIPSIFSCDWTRRRAKSKYFEEKNKYRMAKLFVSVLAVSCLVQSAFTGSVYYAGSRGGKSCSPSHLFRISGRN